MKKLILSNPDVAIKLTAEQAAQFGIDITQDQIHGELQTVGTWQLPVSYKALCISAMYKPNGQGIEQLTIYGLRTMAKCRHEGYHLEGRVSLDGQKYSAFTSSMIFDVDGKLIDVAVIHARVN